MTDIYKRPELAKKMANQLLDPGPLDEGLRSGLFLSGQRRTGKTTFLITDLVPALEAAGALVIYVDLWSDVSANPSDLIRAAVREKLREVQTPASGLLQRLKRINSAELAAYGVSFSFNLDTVGQSGGVTLAAALTELVDQARVNVVFIVDEVQHAITTEDGQSMLFALKSARDAINPRPDTPGRFLFIGTGSHRAHVNELVARRNQAFTGATSLPYPVLGVEYVAHLLARLSKDPDFPTPSLPVAAAAFTALGCRPEEMLKALRNLPAPDTEGSAPPDVALPLIAKTLRSSAADLEISKVENLGPLAVAVFDRVASKDQDVQGIFSREAAAEYSSALGRTVRVEDVQPVANALMSENVIMRSGHGSYSVSDPFVRDIWRERRGLERRLSE